MTDFESKRQKHFFTEEEALRQRIPTELYEGAGPTDVDHEFFVRGVERDNLHTQDSGNDMILKHFKDLCLLTLGSLAVEIPSAYAFKDVANKNSTTPCDLTLSYEFISDYSNDDDGFMGSSVAVSNDGNMIVSSDYYNERVGFLIRDNAASRWRNSCWMAGPSPDIGFGYKISLSGDSNWIAISAPDEENGVADYAGSVYIYKTPNLIDCISNQNRGTIKGKVDVFRPQQGTSSTSLRSLRLSRETKKLSVPMLDYLPYQRFHGGRDDIRENDWFGYAIALSHFGSILVATAPNSLGKGGKIQAGAMEIYLRTPVGHHKTDTQFQLLGLVYGDLEYTELGKDLALSDDGTIVTTSTLHSGVYIYEIRPKDQTNPIKLIQTIPVGSVLRLALSATAARLMISVSGTSDDYKGSVTF